MQIVVGSIVARCSSPFVPLGILVGVSSCGMLATVDRGEFAGFPGSRYSRPLMRELVEFEPPCDCGRCYSCVGGGPTQDAVSSSPFDADFGAEGFPLNDLQEMGLLHPTTYLDSEKEV